jgi:hypothetical protein
MRRDCTDGRRPLVAPCRRVAELSDRASELSNGEMLIAGAREQASCLLENLAVKRRFEQTAAPRCDANEFLGRPRTRLETGLEVVEVRLDSLHPVRQIHGHPTQHTLGG